MHICLLIPVLDAYKGGNHLPLLAALPDVQFTILCNRTKPESPDLPPNVKVIILGGSLGPYYYGCSDYLFARSVLKKYPASDPFWKQFSVIHLNQTMGPALLKLKATGVPLMLLIHHPASVDRAVAVEESGFFGGLLWRLKYLLLVSWQKKFCHAVDHVVTVSKTSAQRIAADYQCNVSSIEIVPNGIDPQIFTPGDLLQSEFDVISIGSFIHPRKGFKYLLNVYKILAAKGFKIADVGRRSAEQQEQLKTISGVTTFGTVSEEKLVTMLKSSAVLISTSLYEGFGLSLIEALACGRPAIAFDAGATKEVLSPIDPSLVVPLRDSAALTRRVEEFLRLSPAERASKGQQYREAVVRMYPLEESARRLKEVYESIAG